MARERSCNCKLTSHPVPVPRNSWPPRFIPYTPNRCAAAAVHCQRRIYADAFFLEGRPGRRRQGGICLRQNGGGQMAGYVVRIGNEVHHDLGMAPAWFVRTSCRMLEILAQILQCQSLNNGYGRDPAVSGLLSALWLLAARRGSHLAGGLFHSHAPGVAAQVVGCLKAPPPPYADPPPLGKK